MPSKRNHGSGVKPPLGGSSLRSLAATRERALRERQARMRTHHAAAVCAPDADASIAGAWLAVHPDGSVRASVHHVQREHVGAMIAALDALRDDLASFLEAASAGKDRGRVMVFPTRNSSLIKPVPRAA